MLESDLVVRKEIMAQHGGKCQAKSSQCHKLDSEDTVIQLLTGNNVRLKACCRRLRILS